MNDLLKTTMGLAITELCQEPFSLLAAYVRRK